MTLEAQQIDRPGPLFTIYSTGGGGKQNPARRAHDRSREREVRITSIIGTLVIGLLAGLVARFLMPGRDAAGFIVTMLLGVAGAFVATWLGQALGWYRAGQPAGFIGAVIGALLILLIHRLFVGRRS